MDFGKILNNQRKYFDWFEKKMNFKDKSDWYSITIKEIKNNGGSGLLNRYNDSLQYALESIYPNYEWIPWKFNQTPKNYWLNIENQRKYFNWLSNQLNIKSNEDWYNIKLEKINSLMVHH